MDFFVISLLVIIVWLLGFFSWSTCFILELCSLVFTDSLVFFICAPGLVITAHAICQQLSSYSCYTCRCTFVFSFVFFLHPLFQLCSSSFGEELIYGIFNPTHRFPEEQMYHQRKWRWGTSWVILEDSYLSGLTSRRDNGSIMELCILAESFSFWQLKAQFYSFSE